MPTEARESVSSFFVRPENDHFFSYLDTAPERGWSGAVAAAKRAAPDLQILAGGHSFGGRMTTGAQPKRRFEGVRVSSFSDFHCIRQDVQVRSARST